MINREKDGSSSSSEEEDYGELDAVEEELNALRGQAELARKTAAEFERLYKETAAKLVTTQAEMEDMEHKAVLLQKKLRRAQGPGAKDLPDITNLGVQTDPVELPPPADYHRPLRSLSKRDVRKQMARQVLSDFNMFLTLFCRSKNSKKHVFGLFSWKWCLTYVKVS